MAEKILNLAKKNCYNQIKNNLKNISKKYSGLIKLKNI